MKTLSIHHSHAHQLSETVEIHFEGASLPSLTQWTVRSRENGSPPVEITALASPNGKRGRRIHWNLPLMALSLALLRLESRRNEKAVLLDGVSGSSAGMLAECFTNQTAAYQQIPVLLNSDSNARTDGQTPLNRWFELTSTPHQPDHLVVLVGKKPPTEVIVYLDGTRLPASGLEHLAARLEWMTEERDWLGAIVGHPHHEAAA